MLRLKPIRPAKLRGPSRKVRRAASDVFWIALVFASAFGAHSVASAIPKLLELSLPARTIAAEASVQPAPHVFHAALLHGPAGMATPEIRSTVEGDDDLRSLSPVRTPAIAIVIDDLGADAAHTRQAIALPQAVTLSFLPYPADTPRLAREAGRAGHEILAHVPMEAVGAHNPGPFALTTGLLPEEIVRRLDWALSRVPGYCGINNHEGSRFTADREYLAPVMEHLAGRHVFFFDSRTTPESQVLPMARAFGVASASRDVFLDDVETIDAVDAQLRALERRATEQGTAIAIGHPHEITLDAVAYWATHNSGFELIPLSEAIRRKTEREARVSRSLAGR